MNERREEETGAAAGQPGVADEVPPGIVRGILANVHLFGGHLSPAGARACLEYLPALREALERLAGTLLEVIDEGLLDTEEPRMAHVGTAIGALRNLAYILEDLALAERQYAGRWTLEAAEYLRRMHAALLEIRDRISESDDFFGPFEDAHKEIECASEQVRAMLRVRVAAAAGAEKAA